MKMDRRRPFAPARGVTQLMYVGDDTAVEVATGKQHGSPDPIDVATAAIAAFNALSCKGPSRWLSAGIAVYFGLKVLRGQS